MQDVLVRPSGNGAVTKTQKRILTSLTEGTMRTDQGNWTFGELASVASLVRLGWATESCGRLNLTESGREELDQQERRRA